jgi:uncharacterized membrane protein
LNDDLKGLTDFIVEVQQVTDDDQMSGTGYRQEFRQTLNQAEYEGLDQQQYIHSDTVNLGVWASAGQKAPIILVAHGNRQA